MHTPTLTKRVRPNENPSVLRLLSWVSASFVHWKQKSENKFQDLFLKIVLLPTQEKTSYQSYGLNFHIFIHNSLFFFYTFAFAPPGTK